MIRFARLAAAGLALACPILASAQADAPSEARLADALPDWSGIWIAEGAVPEISGFPGPSEVIPYKLLPNMAPWNENGRARVKAVMDTGGGRKAFGWGYPMMMSSSAPLQFLVTPDETLILNVYRDIRHVYTDGRSLPPEEDRWPTVWGESVGRWEGDTLVIETVSVENPNDYFFSSPPLSPNARYVERIRKTAPDRIEVQMTIDDPETLSRPWVAEIALVRAEGLDRLIHEAYTNDRNEVENGVFTIQPPREIG